MRNVADLAGHAQFNVSSPASPVSSHTTMPSTSTPSTMTAASIRLPISVLAPHPRSQNRPALSIAHRRAAATTTGASPPALGAGSMPLHLPMPPLKLGPRPTPYLPTPAHEHPPTPSHSGQPHHHNHTHAQAHSHTHPRTLSSEHPAAPAPTSTSLIPSIPFYDNIRQHLELAQGVSVKGFEPLRLDERVREYYLTMPSPPAVGKGSMHGQLGTSGEFNMPAVKNGWGRLMPGWLREVVDRSEVDGPSEGRENGMTSPGGTGLGRSSTRSPMPHMKGSIAKPDRGEALAMQFYRIELAEQRRLMGVMEHHTKESGAVVGAGERGPSERGANVGEWDGFVVGGAPAEGEKVKDRHGADGAKDGEEFPFSITAGVEKGTLNRYRNIWPFAHTRVRLPEGTASDGSDYVNASFVHPRGTRRRYVCAQGPLEATKDDFWNLVWDQNITTIIMLTKQTEAGLSKCFPYWQQPMAGPFRLRHLSTTGGEDEPSTANAGFFDLQGATHEERGAIRRVFALSREGVPGERLVTQLQMVSWPDWEVPRSPRPLLDLIKQTNALRAASPDPDAPVLVHCSAGVGRTGSFVLIDAVLDGLRHELLKTKARVERGERATQITPPHADRMHLDSVSYPGSGTGTTTNGSPSFSSLSLSLHPAHRQSPLDSSAPTSRSPSTDISLSLSLPPSPGAALAWEPKALQQQLLSELEQNPQTQNSFDYKMPRSAMMRAQPPRTPTPLSDMGADPIQSVLEDMREQRMSLCQSLSQYVFCHRVICEGAIELAEEIFGPTEYTAALHAAGIQSGPSTLSPNAMDVEPASFFPPGVVATPGALPVLSKPFPLHIPQAHAKRHASKSPEEVERVLSLSPLPTPSGYASHNVVLPDGHASRKPSLKRQMTRRGDVGSGAASPGHH